MWQVTPKHAYIYALPNEVGVSQLCRCSGRVWELMRKRARTQLIKEHLATVVSVAELWWTDPGLKSEISARELIFTLKKKKSAGEE